MFQLEKLVRTSLVVLFFSSAVGAQVKSNWSNPMLILNIPGGGHGEDNVCVQVGPNYSLDMTLYLNTSTNQIDNAPPMKLKYAYYIDNVQVLAGLTPTITSAMLASVNVPPGFPPLYEVTFPISYNCEFFCENNESGNAWDFDFTLECQLVTPNSDLNTPYIAYPIGQFPKIWSPVQFKIPSPSYTDPLHSETHHMCCLSEGIVMEGSDKMIGGAPQLSPENADELLPDIKSNPMTQASTASSGLAKVDGLVVQPNPFTNDLKISFNLTQAGPVFLTCLDAQGRVLKTYVEQLESAGFQASQLDLSDLSPGLYYLKVATTSGAQVVKVVKSNN